MNKSRDLDEKPVAYRRLRMSHGEDYKKDLPSGKLTISDG